MRNSEQLFALVMILLLWGAVIYCFFRFAKSLFLPKSRLHIALGVVIFGLVLLLLGRATYERELFGAGIFFIVIGVSASTISIFVAKIMAEKYQRYMRKGKSTTAEQLMASLKKKDVDTVLFELYCLIDRGYLPGFAVNMESHAVTPATSKDAVQELGRTFNRTISAFKNNPASGPGGSICKKCGAAIPDDGSARCEFCGAPISR